MGLLVPGSLQRVSEVEWGPCMSLGRVFCWLTPEPKLDKGKNHTG